MYRFVEAPPSRAFRITDFASSAIADSGDAANLVPITTPSAPNARAATIPLASTIPPAARTGVCGMVARISGTSEMILAEFAAP